MDHAIEFIETHLFTKQIKSLATDDELRRLQHELIAQPEKGDLIQDTGGLRKVRMSAGNQGKSSSLRVVYFLAAFCENKGLEARDLVYLVMAYPKSVKDNLTGAEKAELKKLTKLLKSEV